MRARWLLLFILVTLALVALNIAPGRAWDQRAIVALEPQVMSPQGDVPSPPGGPPPSGLPFLMAAFAITWAAFFAYLFFLSQRERDLRKEIQDLKGQLKEKEKE